MKECTIGGCARPHRARGFCSTHYNQLHLGQRRYPAKVEISCYRCGAPCMKRPDRRRPRQYCSLACRTAEQFKEVRARRPAPPGKELILRPGGREPRPQRQAERRSEWWKLLIAGDCAHCGTYFVAPAASIDTASRYCSVRCRRASGKSRRRAMRQDAFVAPVSPRRIFERDRWTCKLCGKRVKREAEAPDPNAPTLDHIIPLAAGPENGGVHAPWNVQCAHFLCNSLKRDAWSQGALF